MTEQEWLTSYDPQAMLRLLQGDEEGGEVSITPPESIWKGTKFVRIPKPSDRKLRLFACAGRLLLGLSDYYDESEIGVPDELHREGVVEDSYHWAQLWTREEHYRDERISQQIKCGFLRDIFGNPFLPSFLWVNEIPPMPLRERRRWLLRSWLTWNDGIVRKIAQSIYDERRFEDMPVLADVLEEAGCDNLDVISHLRGWERCLCLGEDDDCKRCVRNGVTTGMVYTSNPHVRGCWCLDLLLGKE